MNARRPVPSRVCKERHDQVALAIPVQVGLNESLSKSRQGTRHGLGKPSGSAPAIERQTLAEEICDGDVEILIVVALKQLDSPGTHTGQDDLGAFEPNHSFGLRVVGYAIPITIELAFVENLIEIDISTELAYLLFVLHSVAIAIFTTNADYAHREDNQIYDARESFRHCQYDPKQTRLRQTSSTRSGAPPRDNRTRTWHALRASRLLARQHPPANLHKLPQLKNYIEEREGAVSTIHERAPQPMTPFSGAW